MPIKSMGLNLPLWLWPRTDDLEYVSLVLHNFAVVLMLIEICFSITTRLLFTFLTVVTELIPRGRCFLGRSQWPVIQSHSGDPGVNGRRSHKSCRWTTEGLWILLFGGVNLWWCNCLMAFYTVAAHIYRMQVCVCICSVCLCVYTNWEIHG